GEASAKLMGLDQIDVLLIHWPNPITGLYRDAWRGLVELRERGVARSIGVSNFTPEHLAHIIEDTGVTPAVNQIELHPWFIQTAASAEHARLGIVTQAWSPLGKRNAPFGEDPVVAAADRAGVSPAQAILRWHVELGNIPLPKSATSVCQKENLDIFDFELNDDEVAEISSLGLKDGRLFDGDPEKHEEM